MTELQFEAPVADGVLVGHRSGGEGLPALVLHGGPAMSDYTDGLVAELGGLFSTIRYTQRGSGPSTVGPPYSIESHVGDAVAVLDHVGVERAWAVGHSWGGHLALHLAVAIPDRLLGVVLIAPLGAYGGAMDELREQLRRPLTPEQRMRVDALERVRADGEATEEQLQERWSMLWPQYFADPATAPRPTAPSRPEASLDTFVSVEEHFARATLVDGLPGTGLPMLFVHGSLDPLPFWSTHRTASLVPGAKLETIADCGHYPWWERPGELRRIVGEFLAR